LATNDLNQAATEYRTLNQEHPKDLQVKKTYTEILIHTGRLDEARNLCEEILKADPNDNDALIDRAQLQIRAGEANAAVETLRTVVKNDPNNGLAHYQLGVAWQKMGNLESAENEWREAIRLRPDLTDAQRDLAVLAMRKGDMTTLEQASTQIINLRPGVPDGYTLRAVSEINRKQYLAAEKDIRKAIEVAPGSSQGYIQMGYLNLVQKRFKEAEAAYREALDRDPKSNDALRGLLNAYVAQKQIDAAVAAANAQIAKTGGSSGFYDLLGTVLLQQKKDLNGARVALTKAIELDHKNTDAWMKLGELQRADGRVDQAIATYQQALKENPQEATFYVLLGQLFQSREDWARAEDSYQKALGIRQDDPVAACNLAYVLTQAGGNLDVALSLAQTARRRMPDSPAAADTLGWVYYQKGAYRSAIDSLQEALKLGQANNSPDLSRFHYHLGMAYTKTGQMALARQQLDR
jgi:tetratricopeptide (TPR) repeat protein